MARRVGICSITNCGRPHVARGYCNTHYKRFQRLPKGDPRISSPVLFKRSSGSGTITKDGYKVFNKGGEFLSEHRLTVEKTLGRPLTTEETVHHRNGNRLDNRSENLELWSSSHPRGQRTEDLLAWAKEILSVYELRTVANFQHD